MSAPLLVLFEGIAKYLKNTDHVDALRAKCAAIVPAKQLDNADTLLANANSYRDGLLIQLATWIASPGIDITKRQPGGRSVAHKFARRLRDNHIAAVADAFQNIGKNSPDLVRNNVMEWDSLLTWAGDAQYWHDEPERCHEQVLALFEYACARVAATARSVRGMPELVRGKLTFAATTALLEELRAEGSGGAYEQFTVGALLHAQLEGERRVETKNLNASDKSSHVAGDVQVWSVGKAARLLDAYEVTANDWSQKLPAAGDTMRAHDLARLNVIGVMSDHPAMRRAVSATGLDIAVQDLRGFIASVTAGLTKVQREAALQQLYVLLERRQPSPERVNRYVALLEAHGFTT